MSEVRRRTDEELRELAMQMVRNELYMVAPRMDNRQEWELPFGFLLSMYLAGDDAPDEEWVNSIGCIYEEWSKALPRSINGLPMFMSAQFLHRDDCEPLHHKYEAMMAAMGSA